MSSILGSVIVRYLSLKYHKNYVAANTAAGHCSSEVLSSFNLTTIFQSLMLPYIYLSYVLPVWNQAAKSKAFYSLEVFLKTPNSCWSLFFHFFQIITDTALTL